METKGIRLTHSVYTISIDRYSLMDQTNDPNLMKRYRLPMPKRFLLYKQDKLRIEVYELFNEKKLHSGLNKLQMRLIYYNQIILYQSLYLGLKYDKDPILIKYFRDKYQKHPDTEEDLHCILRDLDIAQARYNSLKEIEGKEKKNFEDIIVGVENVLDRSIDRKLKLFQLKTYVDQAEEKVRQITKSINKKHGRNKKAN